jgi:ElaB/YqjD/DUF883 family membrane-anchored ribosome-binding protein
MDENRLTDREASRGAPVGDTQSQRRAEPGEAEGGVENLYTSATDAVRDVAEQASDLARQAYRQGEQYVQEGRRRYPQAERYYRDSARMVEQQVHESPWLALLLAGTIGYVFALLVHGRD